MKPDKIDLIVADIDGCLTQGSRTGYSLRLIEKLQMINQMSRTDSDVPPVTYCTGRPQPYVECLIQATHGYMPALCEGGAVFYDPVQHSVRTHSAFGKHEETMLARLRETITREMIHDHIMYEPGKVTHVTLLITPPHQTEEHLDKAREIARRFDGEFLIETTRICIHFLFPKLNKGAGIEWLSEHTGIAPQRMAGIGDAHPDLPFLRMMGLSCAPANAHEDLKKTCHLVSDKNDAEATMDFIDQIITMNRSSR
ncbi:MAG: HAD hydrolase family protein [Candidatus Sumerlaeota bacterium]|nr:HAD hydrolase family protein [Candidatus Sumerlaeota bacterium]